MKDKEIIYDIMPLDAAPYVPSVYIWYSLLFIILIILLTLAFLKLKKKPKIKRKKVILNEISKLKEIKEDNLLESKLDSFLNNIIYLTDSEKFKIIKKEFDTKKYANKNINFSEFLNKIENLIRSS